MSDTSLFLNMEVRKLESQLARATQGIRQGKSIPDVVRAADVRVPAVLRGVVRGIPGYTSMGYQAERRLDELVTEQLEKAEQIADLEARKKFLAAQRPQWDFLRGAYGRLWRKADTKARQLLSAPRA